MAIYYCDYENGDDTNNGTSKSTPFQHILRTGNVAGGSAAATASTALAGGDIVYLARGSTWLNCQRIGLTQDITGVLTYGAYDRTGETGEADPIVESYLRIETGDWSLVGSGVWSAAVTWTSGDVARLFFDNVGQAKAASTACTAARPWFIDGTTSDTLYVWSGSDTDNPTVIHGAVAIQISDSTQRSYGLRIVNANNLLIENIHFRGASNAVYLQCTTAAYNMENITLDNITTSCSNWDMTMLGDGTAQMTDITISSPHIHHDLTEDESIYVGSNQDGIRVLCDVNGLIITDVDIRDTRHSGININSEVSPYDNNLAIENVLVSGGTITGSNSALMRGISCNGINGRCKNITVTGLNIIDTCVRNQIQGENVDFYANIIDTVRFSDFADTYFLGVGGDRHNHGGIQVQATATAEVVNVRVFNNTIQNTYSECISLKETSGYPITSATINNNITRSRANEWPVATYPYARNYNFLYTEVGGGGTIEVNNNVFNTDAQSPVTWDGTFYTVEDANTNVASMTGNVEDDPQGNSGDPFLLGLSRPAAPSSAYHAGTFMGHYRDFLGRPFHIPPSIGAYEFTRGFMAQTRTPRTVFNYIDYINGPLRVDR